MDLKDIKHIMQVMYSEAKNMLNEICPENIDVNRYFDLEKTFKSKNDILYTLLVCLQDKQMSDKVIGILRAERKDIFKKLLFDYDSNMILINYNEDTLFETFCKNFTINNIDSKQNLWRLYSKSIISSAKFLNKFESAEDFDNFVNSYNNKKIDLLTMLQDSIYGLGFALACHFLKELGYKDYAKPDIHIRDIFMAFDLCNSNDISVFNAVLEMAEVVNDSAYNIDKLFWLVCSGNFHIDNIMIGRNKEKLIARIRSVLENNKLNTNYNKDLNRDKNNIESIRLIQATKMRKYKNNYEYDYCRLTLNDKVVETFFTGNDKNKQVIDVSVLYNAENDTLIIKKLN